MKSKYYYMIAGLLVVTLSATGCHSPSMSSMRPSASKLAIGVVGNTEFTQSNEMKEYTNKLLQENGVVVDLQAADSTTKAAEVIAAMAANKNIDLLIADAKYSQQLADQANNNGSKKFGLVGTAVATAQANIRIDSINREKQSFTAGYLIASGIPQDQVGVVVKTQKSSQSAEWKGVREGIHYAGMSADPFVMTIDEIMAQDGIEKLKSKKTRVLLLLDPVSEGELARLHEGGKWLFSLYDLPKLYPTVIAKPAPVFKEGVQEQIQSLLNNSWQANATQTVMGGSYFELLKPDAIAGSVERKKSVEDALRNGSVKPEQFTNLPQLEKTKTGS